MANKTIYIVLGLTQYTIPKGNVSTTITVLSEPAAVTTTVEDSTVEEYYFNLSSTAVVKGDIHISSFNTNRQLPFTVEIKTATGEPAKNNLTFQVEFAYAIYLNGEPDYFKKFKINGASLFDTIETNWYRDECDSTLTTGQDYIIYKPSTGNNFTFNDVLFSPKKPWHNYVDINYKQLGTKLRVVKKGYLPQNFYLQQAGSDNMTLLPGAGGCKLNSYIMAGNTDNTVLIQKWYDDKGTPFIWCSHVDQNDQFYSTKSPLIIAGVEKTANTVFKKLGYVPNLLTVTLGGAGGGGAGGYNNNGGGGGGGIAVAVINIDISHYKIVLGKYGDGGSANSAGSSGNASKIFAVAYSETSPVCICYGGKGGTHGTSTSKLGKGGAGGTVYCTSSQYCYLAASSSGGKGGNVVVGIPPESEQTSQEYCGYNREPVIFGMVSDNWKNGTIEGATGGGASFALARPSIAGGGAGLGWGGGRGTIYTGNLGGGGAGGGMSSTTGATGGRGWCVIAY